MNNKTNDSLRNTCVLRDVGGAVPYDTFVKIGNELNGRKYPELKNGKTAEKAVFCLFIIYI